MCGFEYSFIVEIYLFYIIYLFKGEAFIKVADMGLAIKIAKSFQFTYRCCNPNYLFYY